MNAQEKATNRANATGIDAHVQELIESGVFRFDQDEKGPKFTLTLMAKDQKTGNMVPMPHVFRLGVNTEGKSDIGSSLNLPQDMADALGRWFLSQYDFVPKQIQPETPPGEAFT